jgi:phosphoribosylanthranilate isomerase
MADIENFLDPTTASLKICGVTTREDAMQLAAMGVDALGVNFWPSSKRYLAPAEAEWLQEMGGKILRVGVFVNAAPELPLRLFSEGLIDMVQLHGDESVEDAEPFRNAQVPFIKAIGVKTMADLANAASYGASAVLLDAHAPGIYGGTGETFDWEVASDFRRAHSNLPVILAGGIVPGNAGLAVMSVLPAALDIASGAEHSPGIKDFEKVAAFLRALNR